VDASLRAHTSHNRVAILITCHNRRDVTLNCLRALHGNRLPPNSEFVVYLVDDGSSDGTGAAVRKLFAETIVINGDGSLYWTKGTWIAFDVAMRADHDFYLWLNDDLFLDPQALETLLATYSGLVDKGRPLSIVIGSTRDPRTGVVTYGGQVHASSWHPLRLMLVEPNSFPKRCHTMNGNCVLIPSMVAERVGNLDPEFTHRIGDIDYGFRARKLGCELWIAPGFVGVLSRNPVEGSWEDTDLALRERWQKATGPKGLPPREWRILLKRVAGPLWPFFWLIPYLKLVLQPLVPRARRR
jgi:GT2 family glycosyltransferase